MEVPHHKPVSYPLSQDFHSVQGEGVHVGTSMHFVRVAGCNVGMYTSPEELVNLGDPAVAGLRAVHTRHSVCTSVTGKRFLCDTDYHVNSKSTVADIITATWERHLCITGGEPFMFDLHPLVYACLGAGIQVHVETSGTLQIPVDIGMLHNVWITCSPKLGYKETNAQFVDEFKFILHSDESHEDAIEEMDSIAAANPSASVFVQPVNDVNKVDEKELQFVLSILRQRPTWRLSCQLHKLIGVE